MSKQPFSATNISRRRLVLLIVLLLLLYVVVPRLGNFTQGVDIFWHAQPAYVLLCVVCTAATYLMTADIYKIMAKKPVPLREIAIVQAATALTNRLLPAGIGSMGLNAAYLQKRGHRLNDALSVVAANNTLGFVGHMILFAAILGLSGFHELGVRAHFSANMLYIILGVVAIITINLVIFRHLRDKLFKGTWSVILGILEYRERPLQASMALGLSMVLTMLYVFTLYLSAAAIGVDINFGSVFMAFTIATFVGTVTPTPGGLVGMEAALVAALAAYGVDAGHALAITLLYRFTTYWLPMIPGYFAFRYVQRRYL